MPRLEFCTEIAAPVKVVWRFHDGVEVLPRILPPTTRVRLLNPPERLGPGADRLSMRRQIEGLFAYRHAATKRLLETPHPHV